MATNNNFEEFFKGFSKLERQERFNRLRKMGVLSSADIKFLNNDAPLEPELAEHFIENVIGYFQMPLGVATNFRIDNKDYVIPMAVEETSIIAAASKTAKWIRDNGEITTHIEGNTLIGQIQIANVKDFANFEKIILAHKDKLIHIANNDVAAAMVQRGGGIKDLTIRQVARLDSGHMAVLHIHVDTCDAMGANIINQICEYLKEHIQELTDETVTMCILSNLNDRKLTHARVVIRDIEEDVGHAIAEASHFAACDPYRATTNNKGVVNAIDAMLIATGNDWRAVESGIHAYAAHDGQYRSVTQWQVQGKDLVGTFKAPLVVATVGGVTRLHPTAKLCLRMLNVDSANELSRVVAAVGLVQNLGAIRALTSVGIIQGHMKLHITNLTLGSGAEPHEIPIVKKRLEQIFSLKNRISLTNAIDVLKEIREQRS